MFRPRPHLCDLRGPCLHCPLLEVFQRKQCGELEGHCNERQGQAVVGETACTKTARGQGQGQDNGDNAKEGYYGRRSRACAVPTLARGSSGRDIGKRRALMKTADTSPNEGCSVRHPTLCLVVHGIFVSNIHCNEDFVLWHILISRARDISN